MPSLWVVRKWTRMFLGKSGLHVPQPPGPFYRPGHLAGYYNDLRRKVGAAKHVDERGLPLNRLRSGELVHLPTTITQFGLGCWDLYLETGSTVMAQRAGLAGKWLVDHVDQRGGWHALGDLGTRQPGPLYSAMVQGQAASLLLRLAAAGYGESYRQVAEKALELMLVDVRDGGTARRVKGRLFLEEDVTGRHVSILNGWVFAIFGLYDGVLATSRPDFQEALDGTVLTLASTLEQYDAGFWSLYDLSGHLASPFYHRLHLALLTVLSSLFPGHGFESTFQQWSTYLTRRLNVIRAVAVKGWQKLRYPEDVVVVE